jgi:hypothetical protein
VRLLLVGALADDDELVPTEAGDGDVDGHGAEQACGHTDQQLVADVVPA